MPSNSVDELLKEKELHFVYLRSWLLQCFKHFYLHMYIPENNLKLGSIYDCDITLSLFHRKTICIVTYASCILHICIWSTSPLDYCVWVFRYIIISTSPSTLTHYDPEHITQLSVAISPLVTYWCPHLYLHTFPLIFYLYLEDCSPGTEEKNLSFPSETSLF